MGKASGVLLLMGGVGLAAYVALPTSKPVVPSSDDFDFGLTQTAPNRSDSAGKAATPAPPMPSPTRSAASDAGNGQTSSAVVMLGQHNRSSVRLAVAPQGNAGALPTDRAQLARDLQKELRRVGCYDGEINGGWTTSTKRAMKTFMERVNASLPVEEPDLVLLTLVQGQPDKTCGRPCPAGESAADGGRCVPTAVAGSARKPVPAQAKDGTAPAIGFSTAAGPPASSSPPTDGRQGVAGPDGQDEDTAAGGPPAVVVPSGLTRQPGAGFSTPINEARGAAASTRAPSRRFDAQSFFRRMDKQSAN